MAATVRKAYGMDEDEHVRDLLRAWGTFLNAVEADPALSSRTRLSAAGLAAALQRMAGDWPVIAREWRLMRSNCSEAQQHLRGLERKLVDLRTVLEEEEWPSVV